MREHEEKAMERIRIAHEIAAAKGNALVVAYSGGKDSDVLLDLAKRSGAPFKVEHNHTTADAPQPVYHIRRVFAELAALGIPCKINYPPYIKAANGGTERATMWNLIPKKLTPPTRILRYCCDFFKERRFDRPTPSFRRQAGGERPKKRARRSRNDTQEKKETDCVHG